MMPKKFHFFHDILWYDVKVLIIIIHDYVILEVFQIF
jgi:hypothetical protein